MKNKTTIGEHVLRISNVSKFYKVKSKRLFTKPAQLQALNNISVDVYKGETLGVIGESGCGKTTFGKCIVRLTKPESGEIIYEDRDILKLGKEELRKLRRRITMVFQDPYSSLDPRQTAGDAIQEPMNIHNLGSIDERKERVYQLLEEVGLSKYHATRYPHEFSGGQRQRVNIARALATNPEVVVCDEPVSALDVSVQAQVLNLLNEMKAKYNLTYIFISHDLQVVRYISDRIMVMYLGNIVEFGRALNIYNEALHPYTKILMLAAPPESPFEDKATSLIQGEPASPLDMPKGCVFSTRCPRVKDVCLEIRPELRNLSEGHLVACHFPLKPGEM